MNDDFLSDDDLRTWQHVAKTVVPLAGKEFVMPEEHEETEEEKSINEEYLKQLLAKKQSVEGKKQQYNYLKHGETQGVDKSTAKRLKEGKYNIEARLDMHGRTQDEALEGMRYFIKTSYDLGKRCVLLITGKGSGEENTLKNQVPRWMNVPGIREYVLAFSYANPKHGGEGAIYVLIRRKK